LLFITVFGYLDDRYELRSLVKLACQIIFLSIFSLVAANDLNFSNSSIAFLAIFIIGLASVNGANFLDGLDAMSVKIALGTLLVLGLFADINNYDAITFLCAAYSVPILAFYLFNKFPATIHLGETGGSALGLTMLYLGILLTRTYNTQETVSFSGLFLIAIPMMMYISEAIVTTLRRLLIRRSPFIGDQFHIHHILHLHKKLSINQTTSAISGFNVLVMALSLSLLGVTNHAVLIVIAAISLCLSIYFSIGWNVWFGKRNTKVLLKSFFTSLKKERILLIDSSLSESFQVKVYRDQNEEENEEKKSA